MTDEPDSLLDRLTPRGAPPELRARVLAAVSEELARQPRSRRVALRGWAVAAGILLAIALNGWVSRRSEARLAGLYGPESTPGAMLDLARTVESAADAETARWAVRQFVLPRQSREVNPFQIEQEFIQASTEIWEATRIHVPAQAAPEKTGAGARRAADRLIACQRDPGLDHGQPA